MLLLEKRCEPKKTVGIARAAPLGSDGRFALGRITTGYREGFSSFPRTLPTARMLKRHFLGMSRKLIEAHEQERTRIGRDLHDDVVQRLALLAIELEGVQQDVPDSASELRSRIGDLRNQTTQITNDVQLLSHELHSSKLEYLGIVGATRNFCKEFGEHQKIGN